MARIGIYNNAIQAIADHEVTIVVRGVDITRLRARYRSPEHPHSIVLTHLIERVDEYVEGRDELALLIADEVGTPDEYRQSLWHYQRTGFRPRPRSATRARRDLPRTRRLVRSGG